MRKADHKRISPAISRNFMSFYCFFNAKRCEKPEFECISMLINVIYTAIDGDFTEIVCIFMRNDLNHRWFACIYTEYACIFMAISKKVSAKHRR